MPIHERRLCGVRLGAAVALAAASVFVGTAGVVIAAPVTTAATNSSGDPVGPVRIGNGGNGAATGPVTNGAVGAAIDLPVGPLTVTVTGIEGLTQYRGNEKEAWKPLKVGLVLAEGSEFRTGPRSAVQFVIPPGQTVTLDRLSTIKVLRATFQDGKVMTNLGMKFGRTRYDVETGGIEHRSTISSPGSTLAVRGTQVSLYDQPPFAPEAISLTGRAEFRDFKRSGEAVAFGAKGAGKTKVAAGKRTPADVALAEGRVDSSIGASARSGPENSLQQVLSAYGGNDVNQLGVFALLGQTRATAFKGTLIGSLPIDETLQITMDWTGETAINMDLTVISPLGEVVDKTRTQKNPVASGGQHSPDTTSKPGGLGLESVSWVIHFPAGVYTVKANNRSQADASVEYTAVRDPEGKNITVKTLSLRPIKAGETLTSTFKAP